MRLTRRDFLLLTTGLTAGCTAVSNSGKPTASTAGTASSALQGPSHLVNAGPASRYAADGIYSDFQKAGFFLVRQGGKLTAVSSYCTHRRCRLNAVQQGFECPCHGSTFTLTGHVTEGPATRDLPVLKVETGPDGNVRVLAPMA